MLSYRGCEKMKINFLSQTVLADNSLAVHRIQKQLRTKVISLWTAVVWLTLDKSLVVPCYALGCERNTEGANSYP